jgi:hypothetical protein
LGIRFHRFGIDRLEIIAEIGPQFVVHELRLVIPALMMRGLSVKPAVQAAMKAGSAFRTRLLSSDFPQRLDFFPAGSTIHNPHLLANWLVVLKNTILKNGNQRILTRCLFNEMPGRLARLRVIAGPTSP